MSATPEAARGEIRDGHYIPRGTNIAEVQDAFFSSEPTTTIDERTRVRIDFNAKRGVIDSVLRLITREDITQLAESRMEIPVFPGLKPTVHTVWEPPSELGLGAASPRGIEPPSHP